MTSVKAHFSSCSILKCQSDWIHAEIEKKSYSYCNRIRTDIIVIIISLAAGWQTRKLGNLICLICDFFLLVTVIEQVHVFSQLAKDLNFAYHFFQVHYSQYNNYTKKDQEEEEKKGHVTTLKTFLHFRFLIFLGRMKRKQCGNWSKDNLPSDHVKCCLSHEFVHEVCSDISPHYKLLFGFQWICCDWMFK